MSALTLHKVCSILTLYYNEEKRARKWILKGMDLSRFISSWQIV